MQEIRQFDVSNTTKNEMIWNDMMAKFRMKSHFSLSLRSENARVYCYFSQLRSAKKIICDRFYRLFNYSQDKCYACLLDLSVIILLNLKNQIQIMYIYTYVRTYVCTYVRNVHIYVCTYMNVSIMFQHKISLQISLQTSN